MSWISFDERMPGPSPKYADPISELWTKTVVRADLKDGDSFEFYVLFEEEPESAETLKEISAQLIGVGLDAIKEVLWYDPD